MKLNAGVVTKKTIVVVSLCVIATGCVVYLIDSAFKTQSAWSEKVVDPVEFSKDLPPRYFVLHTDEGDITIRLLVSTEPTLTQKFVSLVQASFYNGVQFYRTIPDQLIVAGNPKAKTAEDLKPVMSESPASKADARPMMQGVIAAVNNNQFFILIADSAPKLEGVYPVFAEVIDGLDIAKNIAARPAVEGVPQNAVIIKSVEQLKKWPY